MTRMLSELLGAREPYFRLGLQRLEKASGSPNADIRLSSEILRQTQEKIRDLGLDPHDTTGQELYGALLGRLKVDEVHVRDALGVAEGADGPAVMAGVDKFLQQLDFPKSCFALKASVAKRLLKKVAPKAAMQWLGYRSFESFLKHEPVALIFAAAWSCESPAWQQDFIAQYSKLRPSDFEPRHIKITLPKASRWIKFSAEVAQTYKQSCLFFKELGEVVLLPPAEATPGLAITNLLFAVQAINDIRSASVFLKLQQVKPDFGDIVAQMVTGKFYAAQVADQTVPWPIVQHFYGSLPEAYRAELFEPHVQAEDLEWQQTEKVLAEAIPAMEFWADTSALALLDNKQPVSLNGFDVATNFVNQLPYAERMFSYFRENVWHELMLQYLRHGTLEQTVRGQLQSELGGTPSLAEAFNF